MAGLSTPRERWLGDHRLHVLEWGPQFGAPTLLVHGIGENARSWSAFAERAQAHRRIIALDLRGHGESAPAEGEAYEHLDYLADLLEAIDEVGAPVPLIGHSIGGHVCLILAALVPELVQSLVLVDVEAFPPRAQPETLRRAGERSHRVFENLGAVARRLQVRLVGTPEPILWAKAEHDTMEDPGGGRVPRFDRAVLRRVTAPDARPYLRRIQCPVLLLRGAHSDVMRASAMMEMATRIPRSSVAEISGATHWPQLQVPVAFTEAVERFLQETVETQPSTTEGPS